MKQYTKAELEELVWAQLANMEATQEEVRLMKERNALLELEISKLRAKLFPAKAYRKVAAKSSK